MKYLIIAIMLMCFTACQNKASVDHPKQVKDTQLNRSLQNFQDFVYNYHPAEIDLSKNKGLSNFDIDYIFNSAQYKDQVAEKNNIAAIVLLKQYLFHLKNYHQGYDLLSMRKGQAKYLIDYFLKIEHIENKEFVNSGEPYRLGQKTQNNKYISSLIREIKREENLLNAK